MPSVAAGPDEPTDDIVTPDDASQAGDIRRQVEYYLSDSNLASDRFLRHKLDGVKNNPIPIEVIHNFNKMRIYSSFDNVVNSIKQSPFLEVVEVGGKQCVKRKVPFVMPILQMKSQKSKTKPTGFEEYYTDPPVTAAEHEEERGLYDVDRPFSERIETALQRYKTRRRFHPALSNVFNRWLAFGGITTGSKQFSGGLDESILDESSARDIAAMTATNFTPEDLDDQDGNPMWVVDFVEIAKAFLSSIVPEHFEYRTEAEFRQAVAILKNFYSYLLHHNVCPEYEEDIHDSITVCLVAEKELFPCNRVASLLPGKYNEACSLFFRGFFHETGAQNHAGKRQWNKADKDGGVVHNWPSREKVVDVVCQGLACYETALDHRDKTMQELYLNQTILYTEVDIGLEVVDIQRADDSTRKLCHDMSCSVLGKLLCKPWTAPDFAGDDLPGDYDDVRPESYEFWLEEEILDWCFAGMKLEAMVNTLSQGRKHIATVHAVRCSFYTLVENELLRKWKEPVWVSREENRKRYNIDSGEREDDVKVD